MARLSRQELLHKVATQDGLDVADPPGLQRRGRRFGIRVRVPDRLRPIFKKREIVETLGDVTAKEARRLAWIRRAEIERDFERAEVQLGAAPILPPSQPTLSDDTLTRIARRAFAWLEANAPEITLDEQRQSQLLDDIREEAFQVGRPGAAEDATLQSFAKSFALATGLAQSGHDDTWPESVGGFKFFEAFREGWLEHLGRQQLRLTGEAATPINPVFANSEKDDGLTLAEAVEMYIAAPGRSGNAASSKKMDRSRLGAFRDLIGGSLSVSAITKTDLRGFVQQLLVLPAHYTQQFRGMTPAEAIAANEIKNLPTLSRQSIKRNVEAVKSLFGWLVRQDLITKNPATYLESPPAPKKSTRRPFEPQEINKLLQATQRDTKVWAYWLVRIVLLHGFRITEPLGLKVGDLIKQGDVWVFRVQPNEYRPLKSADTARDVPVHPELIALGILDLQEGRNSDDLLIPGTPIGVGDPFDPADKQIGRIIRKYVSKDRDLVFHSLRHNFRDAMRDAGLARSIEEKLGGWKPSGSEAMEGYGRGAKLAMLFNGISQVRYEGVEIV